MLVIITKNKYFKSVLFKSNTVLKLLFALIPVNKDLEYNFTSDRERSLVKSSGKKSVVFGSNYENVSFV